MRHGLIFFAGSQEREEDALSRGGGARPAAMQSPSYATLSTHTPATHVSYAALPPLSALSPERAVPTRGDLTEAPQEPRLGPGALEAGLGDLRHGAPLATAAAPPV